MTKQPKTFRLDPRCIEILEHFKQSTGYGLTNILEDVVLSKAQTLSRKDNKLLAILAKTPADYDREKQQGIGIFSKN